MYWLTALAIVWGVGGLYLAIKKPFLGALAGAAGVFMSLWGEWDALVLANETNASTTYYTFYQNAAGPAIILNGLVITVSLFMMMVAWIVQRRQLRTRLPEL